MNVDIENCVALTGFLHQKDKSQGRPWTYVISSLFTLKRNLEYILPGGRAMSEDFNGCSFHEQLNIIFNKNLNLRIFIWNWNKIQKQYKAPYLGNAL